MMISCFSLEGDDTTRQWSVGWGMAKQGALVVASLHTGRPKDEEPHVKQYTKNKKEIIEYVSMMWCV